MYRLEIPTNANVDTPISNTDINTSNHDHAILTSIMLTVNNIFMCSSVTSTSNHQQHVAEKQEPLLQICQAVPVAGVCVRGSAPT